MYKCKLCPWNLHVVSIKLLQPHLSACLPACFAVCLSHNLSLSLSISLSFCIFPLSLSDNSPAGFLQVTIFCPADTRHLLLRQNHIAHMNLFNGGAKERMNLKVRMMPFSYSHACTMHMHFTDYLSVSAHCSMSRSQSSICFFFSIFLCRHEVFSVE